MKKIAYEQMYANELNHAWYIGTRELLINFLEKNANKNAKILDVGCGTGGTLLLLQKRGYTNTFGVDTSDLAITFCKKRKLKNVALGDINNLRFSDQTFDLIICLDVIYHEGVNLSKAVNGLNRVLKSNGILYSQEPAFNFLKGKHDIAIDTGRRFSRASIENVFLRSKFRKIRSSHYNFFLFLPILTLRLISRSKKKGLPDSDVKKLPRSINSIILCLLRIENYVFGITDIPIGVSIVSIWKK